MVQLQGKEKKKKKEKKGWQSCWGRFCRGEEHHMLQHISFFLLRFQCWAVAAASTHGGPGRSHQQHPMDQPSRELSSSQASFPFPVLLQISVCFSIQQMCLCAGLDAWKFTPWSKLRQKVPADSILVCLGATEEAFPLAKEPKHPCQRCLQGGQGCDTDSVTDSVGWERLLG